MFKRIVDVRVQAITRSSNAGRGAGPGRYLLRARQALAVLLLVPALALAQVNTATLHGIVTDASGAALPGATVTLTNSDTASVRTSVTDNAGQYTLPSLQPGTYVISATHAGFSAVKQNDVLLEVGQVSSLDLTLPIGSADQTVTVSTATNSLESTDTSLGTVISQQQVVDLPLNGRQFSQLLELAPGVVPIDNSQNAGKAPNFGAGAVSPSVNGQSNRSNTFFVDGILDSDPFFGGFSFSPSIDDIQEFKEESHTDQAEYGQSTGAVVSIVTRPGGNTLHGSAYEFFRNTVLNAQNRFATTKLPYHQNQFGGSVGGPVLKNKLFFFANYEGGRQSQPTPNYYTVPTAAQLSGDFSGTLPGDRQATIYDPATYNPVTQTEQPFANNVIPTNRIDPGMLQYLNTIYPKPNFTPTAANQNNFFSSIGNTTIGDQGSVRLDYNLGTKDVINGRYSQNNATLSSSGGLQTLFQTGFNGKNLGGNWLHTYSPTLVSQVTVAYNSIDIPQAFATPYDQGALFSAVGLGAGWNEHPGNVTASQVPSVTLSGGSYSGATTGFGPIGPSDIIQVSGSVSKQLGAHALKFGGSFYRTALYTNYSNNNVAFSNKGTWNAACQFVGSSAAATANCPTYNASAGDLGGGGDPVASMLLSLPITATNNLGEDGVNLRSHLYGLFAQDSWAPTKKLTVSYGLRWDSGTPVTETGNRLAAYNIYTHQYFIAKGDKDIPTTPLPSYVVVGPSKTITKVYKGYFQPRIGLAYQVLPRTIVRVGAGRTFDSWGLPLQVAQQDRGGWPSGFSQIASTQNLNYAGISFLPSGAQVSGEEPFSGTGQLPLAPLPSGGLGFQDSKWQVASSVQWNGVVEQDLGKGGVVTLGYVGSHTQHLTIAYPYNLAQPSTNPVKAYPDQTLANPGTDEGSFANANYDAFQASYRRNLLAGLAVNASFTLSRTFGLRSAAATSMWPACRIPTT